MIRFKSSRPARALLALIFGPALLGAKAPASEAMRFDCDIALMMPNRQLTAPAPVSVRFVAEGKVLRDIHVIDTGGILFPGGNMKVVKTADVVRLDAIPIPPERPGLWTGIAEKKMFKMKLSSGSLSDAVTIGLGRKPASGNGRYGLVWNAKNQPEGMPAPISGTGGGNCARVGAAQ